ncbi:MAG TPA: DUF3592 domain-containing protein [Pyrinomonadaceae bacterium]|nr:DUF3592 domain-containing protein [Pyrinomonadaceae bacterium]
MGLLGLFRRKQDNSEAARRARLLRTGRIGEGTIFDIATDKQGHITHVFYAYEINGVEYESSQTLDDAQRTHAADYVAGAPITIRFDPRQPANSVVV